VDNQIEEQTKYLTPQSAAAFRAAEAERQDQLAAERAELFKIVQHVLDCAPSGAHISTSTRI
jgi:hypothetical protein